MLEIHREVERSFASLVHNLKSPEKPLEQPILVNQSVKLLEQPILVNQNIELPQ
jgi:hypothetical protein